MSDVRSGVPFTADDHVRIASITKTFTATAALLLVDRGVLRLDDRLETFVPGVPNGPDITVAQLLNMTSGIFNFTTDAAFSEAFDADPLAPFPLERVLEILRRQPPAFPPGAPRAVAVLRLQLGPPRRDHRAGVGRGRRGLHPA